MKFTVQLEVEVDSQTEFTEAEGRRAAYNLAATLNQVKKGRTPSGPVAAVVGITVVQKYVSPDMLVWSVSNPCCSTAPNLTDGLDVTECKSEASAK
jgi:hypothetical protein